MRREYTGRLRTLCHRVGLALSGLTTPPALWDLFAVAGLVLVALGLAWVWLPACLVFLGLAVLAIGIRGASTAPVERQHRRRRRPPLECVGTSKDRDGEVRPVFAPQIEKGYLMSEEEDSE